MQLNSTQPSIVRVLKSITVPGKMKIPLPPRPPPPPLPSPLSARVGARSTRPPPSSCSPHVTECFAVGPDHAKQPQGQTSAGAPSPLSPRRACTSAAPPAPAPPPPLFLLPDLRVPRFLTMPSNVQMSFFSFSAHAPHLTPPLPPPPPPPLSHSPVLSQLPLELRFKCNAAPPSRA